MVLTLLGACPDRLACPGELSSVGYHRACWSAYAMLVHACAAEVVFTQDPSGCFVSGCWFDFSSITPLPTRSDAVGAANLASPSMWTQVPHVNLPSPVLTQIKTHSCQVLQ